MNARRFKLRVGPDGSLELPPVRLTPGSEVDVILLESEAGGPATELELAQLCSALAEPAMAGLWDNEEEDEAWQSL